MLNSKPNNKNYNQGNYVPENKEKVLKLNSEGGLYYRSGLELKMMVWLDNKKEVIRWGAECIKVPYQLTHYESNGDINLKSHVYYPDFYYELLLSDGTISKVISEVKPMKEYIDVIKLQEKKLTFPENGTSKGLKNFEYTLKMAQKNNEKWQSMIKWADMKGWKFIIITEDHFKVKSF
jgi:hypothetical protein